jgi:tetratricopeptide (TPR) repeat protein
VRELDRAALRNRAPASLDAHERVLRGIALTYAPSAEGLRQARQALEQAIRLDPNYAPAWAHLGWTKTLLIFGNHDPDLGREDLPQAIADIKHAIALDPMLASSWRALSLAIDSSKNPEEAVRAAERAIELGPGDPDNWLALAITQHHAGRTEAALQSYEKAIHGAPYAHRITPSWRQGCAIPCRTVTVRWILPANAWIEHQQSGLQGDLAVVTDPYWPRRRGGGCVAAAGCLRTVVADVSHDAARYFDGSFGR